MTDPTVAGLHHTAVFFSSDADRRRQMTESIGDGLQRRETVLAAVDATDRAAITQMLGPSADAVEFADAALLYRDPPTAMRALFAFLCRQPSGIRLRVVGCARPEEESYPEWIRYEAAVNEIFADTAATGVCFHDEQAITADIRRMVEQTHAFLGPTCAGEPSPRYATPRAVADMLPARRLNPARSPDLAFTVQSEIRPVRMLARDLAPPGRAEEVEMVAHELVALAALESPCPPEVRFWREPGALVVQVAASLVFDDPFAGLRPPGRDHATATWVAGQLADAFAIDRSDEVSTATAAFSS